MNNSISTAMVPSNTTILNPSMTQMTGNTVLGICPTANNPNAEIALKKIILYTEKEEKKKIQMENKTKISKVLFLSITEKILIIILILFFIPPLLDEALYSSDSIGNYFYLSNLISKDKDTNNATVSAFISNFIKEEKHNCEYPMIYIYYNRYVIYTNKSLDSDLITIVLEK